MQAQYPTGTVLFQLVRLELCSCEDNWTNMLVSVLQHAPKLQVLKLELNQYHCLAIVRKVCWIQPERVPECLLFHLKTFEWRDYKGTQAEKEVAMYILKNARRLVNATIYPDSVKLVRKHRMFEELEIASRDSRACELTMG
ncbi:F-box/FBD/LRR-repeat protein At5g56420 [Arabidopsis lyrata subsp. lyrata]|uniref:F-box/FBD/LRR-repeat protein At5g56420 n=1 Tax=Arabidopsis lyrata subsp. lyrata TaxID=81972 RepID=UPI000A29B3E6|nr:F-box/FBD/LRR-repeat protein At5g56420 [Arabidopsis lyrata subsp. lyrata]|eukprot:XP_020885537.1 F-box/FBD/LRR-repeat protein At5g56420 [Arabidopsis lyrata subsp. lyrata]